MHNTLNRRYDLLSRLFPGCWRERITNLLFSLLNPGRIRYDSLYEFKKCDSIVDLTIFR